MQKDGFWMGPTSKTKWKDGHIKIYRSRTNHMCVDLFFWKHDGISGVMKSGGLNAPKSFPVWWIEKLERVTIFDKKIWAPREPEKFLRMRFGKDWKTPQNKKVHSVRAKIAHVYGFKYASKYGWKKGPQLSIRFIK